MSDTSSREGLNLAEENIWYQLMTLHGVAESPGNDERAAIHAKNRDLWNRWTLPALSDETIKILGLTHLEPLTKDEIANIDGNFPIEELPDPNNQIDLSRTLFSAPLKAVGFAFPSRTDFTDSKFERTADFTDAYFEDHVFSIMRASKAVRHHINWNTQRLDLREDLAHLVDNVKRHVCGIASTGSP